MSRKRPAPGADASGPANYQQIQSNQWPGATMDAQGNYSSPQDFTLNSYQSGMPSLQRETSNQLTRRPSNQLGLSQFSGGNAYLPVGSNDGNSGYLVQQTDESGDANQQSKIDELERQADIAERSAASKRKSIPPFVQKLRSFVDDEKNSNLIRWSADGDSFVVLDEDDFAKILIPELFKHNKYPSFVRQLNMYGFHKRVALSDNSMRASERKSKSPSEYSNPYFKRGYPKLMWLIQKPKTGQAGGGKKNANGEDVDDDELEGETPVQTGRGRQSVVLSGGQRVLSQEVASQLHEELTAIRRNQAAIQEEVRKLREENELMQTRAANYQAIHQRHENSINAILTFLATVFRNQIEGRDTSSLAGLFPQAAPRDSQHGDRVVDLADLDGREPSTQSNTPRPQRRPLLLTAAPADGNSPSDGNNDAINGNDNSNGRISSVKTPTTPDLPQSDRSTAPSRAGQSATVADASPPADAGAEVKRENNDIGSMQNEDILSLLNSQTSSRGGNINRLDYPQALSQLQSANSRSPISAPQRNEMLRLMANNHAGGVLNGNTNNALTSPSPPPFPGPKDPQWEARSKEFEALERSIQEQDDRFHSVTQLLGPLSPSGAIDFRDTNGSTQPPQDFDLDWLNSSPNDGGAFGGLDSNDNPFFDFNDFENNNGANASGDQDGAGHLDVPDAGIGAVSTDNSEATSPAGTVNTIEDGPNEPEAVDPPSKRQRTS